MAPGGGGARLICSYKWNAGGGPAAPLRVRWNVSKQKGPVPTGCAPHVTSQLISCPPHPFLLQPECQFQRQRRRRRRLRSLGRGLQLPCAPAVSRPRPSAPASAARRPSARPARFERPLLLAQMAHSPAAVPPGALEQGCPIRVEHDRRRRQFTVRLNGNAAPGPPPPPPIVHQRRGPADVAPLPRARAQVHCPGAASRAAEVPPSAAGAGRGATRGLDGGTADSRPGEGRAPGYGRAHAGQPGRAGGDPRGRRKRE